MYCTIIVLFTVRDINTATYTYRCSVVINNNNKSGVCTYVYYYYYIIYIGIYRV